MLKSGFLLGEDYLYRRAAIVDVKQKKGHVILLGFKVQNRYQTFGTFKLLFNAIHLAGMELREKKLTTKISKRNAESAIKNTKIKELLFLYRL